MRVSPQKRRRWNNYLILAVILFMLIFNAPTLIKSYLLPEEPDLPSLLQPQGVPSAFYFADWSLENQQGVWRWLGKEAAMDVAPEELATRWQSLQGTLVDASTQQALQAKLPAPQTLEIWYQEQEEPQRVTFYQLEQFWLMQNWQGDWIAISTPSDYLLPEMAK